MRQHPLILALVMIPVCLSAQRPEGLQGSHFGGVNNITYNPALIANSGLVFDLNLLGASASVSNDYLSFERGFLFNSMLGNAPYDTSNMIASYFVQNNNGKDKELHASGRVLLPSFIATLDNGHAFGTHARLNAMTSVTGMPNSVATLLINGFDYPAVYGLTLASQDLATVTAAWMDYGFTYAAVINRDEEHSVRVGATLKLLQALGATFVRLQDLSFSLQDIDTLNFLESEVAYGHSDNITYQNESVDFRLKTPVSMAMDFGIAYDYRPAGEDGPYKISLGAALVDAGRLRFGRGDYSQEFFAELNFQNVNEIALPTGIEDLEDTIAAHFTVHPVDDRFFVSLPTHMNVSADYSIGHGFFAQVSASFPTFSPDKLALKHPASLTVSPRYELNWLGVYMPVFFGGGQPGIGAAVRIGPLVVGTSDWLNWITRSHIRGLDAHMYLKIPIARSGHRQGKKTMKVTAATGCPAG